MPGANTIAAPRRSHSARSADSSRGYAAKSSFGPNCVGFTKIETTTNPHYEGFFMYGNNKPHCWSGPVSSSERLKEIAQFIQRKRPEGATTAWWTYWTGLKTQSADRL